MKRFRLTDSAVHDLREIADYLAQRSTRGALRVLSELYDAMQTLDERPGFGHLREDLTDEPLRFWRVRPYLIVYRPEQKPIEIVRVLHGARDVQAILSSQ